MSCPFFFACLVVGTRAFVKKPSTDSIKHNADLKFGSLQYRVVQQQLNAQVFLQKQLDEPDKLANGFSTWTDLITEIIDDDSMQAKAYAHYSNDTLLVKSSVFVGAFAGTMLGGLSGVWVGHPYDCPLVGSLIGAIIGGAAGGFVTWLLGTHRLDYEIDEGKPAIDTTSFSEPAIEKLRQQAVVAAAVSEYEQDEAKRKGNYSQKAVEKAAEKEALHALDDLEKRIHEQNKTGEKEPMEESLDDYEEVQDALSESDGSQMVTAEAATENGAAITADDLARLAGGGKGKRFRAEDIGPNGGTSFQGDMVPGSKKQLALFQSLIRNASFAHAKQTPGIAAGVPWTNAEVRYCFAEDVPSSVKHIFRAACTQYHRAVPCLTFKEIRTVSGSSRSPASQQRCEEAPAIFVQSDPNQGCYSYVGMVESFQSQRLQLQAPGCLSVGTAIHELGHALGMAHEQSRPDREAYVKIHWDNIQQGMQHNFDIDEDAYTVEGYDMISIMHYDAHAFTRNLKFPTISLTGGRIGQLGQRAGLSHSDVSQLVAMYKDANHMCTGSAVAGMGCVNEVDDAGHEMCDISYCSANVVSKCCACGGGVRVQCYKDQPCPKSDPLPVAAADCITDATHLFPTSGVPCIYTNTCDYNVAFSCSGGCNNVATSKQYQATQCNREYVTEVCHDKSVCTFAMV